ncbi:MAG: NAD-dependent dehydratase [Rhodospirillales bacterium 69-11]|nr:SDR family oxidoreductase [Rhodospirillales bacterium]OJW26421.1 MAG: NAD-dependent dehydratase [Rhodospirillales bacterium 69-11]
MRVFVTGATGFVGIPVVKDLIAAGHDVLGLARSDDGARALRALGAAVQRGTLQDLDGLRAGASAADGVLHLAFVHDWANFAESCEIDRRAIEALGSALTGTGKPLIVTSGTGGVAGAGRVATEDDDVPPDYALPRRSEQVALGLAGVRAAVVRLPQVHDTVKQGLITHVVKIARETGVSAYVGDGATRWSAAHVSDVARLYRLALERHEAGAKYHAVAEEGVPMRDIAEAIGRSLNVPVRSLPAEEAAAHFGWLSMFSGLNLMASSEKTRERLGWSPTGPSLIADLERLEAPAA